MELEIKYEWMVADRQKFYEAIKDIYLRCMDKLIPVWKELLNQLYNQIISSYYSQYHPQMYNRIGGGGHLLSAYQCNIIRNGLIFDNSLETDDFITDGHWSITGSNNYSEEGIINYILSGGRSLPPWVNPAKTRMPLTYEVTVYLQEVGYSGYGNPLEVWKAADEKIGKYLTDKLDELMGDEMMSEFFESIGDYIE